MRKYDSYKDSGIEWIGEIPSHWHFYNLKFILREGVKDGPHETPVWFEDGIPFLSIDGIVNGEISFDKCRYIDEEQFEKFSKKLIIEKDDIFIGKAASIGKIARVKTDRKFTVWSPIAVVKVKKEYNPIFVEYYFRSDVVQHQIELLSTSNTQKNIAMGDIPKIKFIAPSEDEQTAIANYLDKKTTQIDDLIAKKERLIQLLEEDRTAIINQAVTKGIDPTVPMKDSGIEWLGEIPAHWEVKKLKQIFNSSKGLTITKENLEDEGIPCVNYGEIHSKFGFEVDIDKHQLKCVNSSYLESDHKSLIQNGDFVFADTSEDVTGAGNFTYLKSNHEIFAGYHTIILRAICDIESRYFAYQFDSVPYRTQIRQAVKGIKVFSITQGILKNTSLWIPTLDEQEQIVKFLDVETNRILSVKNSTRKEIELLKEYKTALISEVVTGKVDVRNENLN